MLFNSPYSILPMKRKESKFSEKIQLVAPQGFEPRSYGPEPHVLPLDEGAKIYS